jgi:hypothetical protein
MKKLIIIFASTALFLSCAEENDEELTPYQKKVIDYFQDLTLGFESGTQAKVIRKWQTEMKIFVGGNPGDELRNELNSVITEINSLASDGFKILLTDDTLQSTSYFFFGSADDFIARYPYAKDLAATNWSISYFYFNNNNALTKTVSYVDTQRTQDAYARKHLLREQLSYSIGFTRNSKDFTYSIFQEAWTTTNFFAEIDKDCIQLLYHPDIRPGHDKATSEVVLTQLVKELGI